MSRLRLASWNLRYDVNPDDTPLDHSLAALPDPLLPPRTLPVGEQPWSARRVAVARTLFTAQVDLIGRCALLRSHVVSVRATGFQETLIRQVRDVAELLGSDYAWVRLSSTCIPSIYLSMLLSLGRRRERRRRLGGRV